MPEYAAKFKISGLLVSGIEMPEREQVDKDFVFQRSSEPESWIALLRVKTEEKEEWFTSKAYEEAKKRLLNFVCIHSIFRGFSAAIENMGVSEIKEGEPLDTSRLRLLTLKAKVTYPESEKPRVLQREYSALERSIEIFKANENALRSYPYLVNAIHYFFYSNLAERIEEKLIDLIISLEALYLTEKMELGYRLSLRVASSIGHLYNDRTMEQIAREIRDLYDKRSSIVHGDPEEITSDEVVSRLMDYTRKSIQMFVKLSPVKSKRDILKLLDDSLFNKSIRVFQ
jgi:hypothetical protein